MPSLSDVLKSNGQLFSTSAEGQKTLKKTTVPGSNESPLAAAIGGVNPDVAKMAGTPAATRVQTTRTSEDAKRTRQDATNVANTGKGKLQAMNPLANLPDTLRNSVGQVVATATATTPDAALTVDDGLLKQNLAAGADPAKAKELGNKALAGTATQAEMMALAPMLGLSPNSSAEEIKTKIQALSTGEGGIGKSLAAALPDDMTLANLTDAQKAAAGLDVNQLGATLGIAPAELAKMTMGQIRQKVDAIGAADFEEVSRLQMMVNDPMRSAAERNEAMNRLRDLGASGIRATEEDFQKFEQELQEDPTVTVGGETVPLSEFLSDEYLTGVATAALKDAAYMDKLKAEQPQIAEFIEKNRAVLETAANKLSAGAKSLADTQINNAKLSKLTLPDGGELVLSEDLMKSLYPSWGSFNGALEKSNFHKNAEGLAGNARVAYAESVTKFLKTDPEMAKYLTNASLKQLQDAGLDTAEGIKDFSEYISHARILEGPGSDESAIQELFGSDWAGLEAMVKQANQMEHSGFLDSNLDDGLLEALDSDGDGRMDSPDQVRANLKNYYSRHVPVKGESLPNPVEQMTSLKAKLEVGQYGMLGKFMPYLQNDGKLTTNELDDYLKAGPGLSELLEVQKSIDKGSVATRETKNLLREAIGKRQMKNWDATLAQNGYVPGQATSFADNYVSAFSKPTREMTMDQQIKFVEQYKQLEALEKSTIDSLNTSIKVASSPEEKKYFESRLASAQKDFSRARAASSWLFGPTAAAYQGNSGNGVSNTQIATDALKNALDPRTAVKAAPETTKKVLKKVGIKL